MRPVLAVLLARIQKPDAEGLEISFEVNIVQNGCSWFLFGGRSRYSSLRQDDPRVPFYSLGHYIARLAVYLRSDENFMLYITRD